jgi:DNA polymerase delta subunit 2
LGTSGQNVDNMYQYLDTSDRLEIAKQSLKSMHIAPTCPDTLWSHPVEEKDTFIIQQLPHIYFIGNQPQFSTELFELENNKTRIILIPKFSVAAQVILVHTTTLDVKVLSFDM